MSSARIAAPGRTRDVLVTGIPRGGTTLIVQLLGKLPGAVALDEPMDARTFLAPGPAAAKAESIAEFLRAQRRSIVDHARAVSFQKGGRVTDNRVGEVRDADGRRAKDGAAKGEIETARDLPADFLLVVKHNAVFAALLDRLSERYTTFAVVRNPAAVLASWHSVALPVGRGHVPTAEAIDAGLAADLASMPDVVGRQIRILDWFCSRFRDFVPAERVIRYEEVVATGGRSLCAVHPAAAALAETLESRNRNELYDRAAMRDIGRRLLATDGAWWHFYSRESVEELLRG